MAGMLETIFFVSLSITFVLILLLVSHFKGRLSALEQKTESMYEIINYVTKEITTMKLLMQQAISLPTMAFTQQSSGGAQAATTERTHSMDGCGLGEMKMKNQPTEFCIKKIVVSDDDDEDDNSSECESDDDSSDGEGDGEEKESSEDPCVSLKVYINRDNTENEWESSDVSRLIDAHMLSSEMPTRVIMRERNSDDEQQWQHHIHHQQIIGLMGGGGMDLGMPTMIVMNGPSASVFSVGTTSSQVEEIIDEDDVINEIENIIVDENETSESGNESDYDEEEDDYEEEPTNIPVFAETESAAAAVVVEELSLSLSEVPEPVAELVEVQQVSSVKEVVVSMEPENYSQMDLATLKRIANERGIAGQGNRKLKKVELIRMLEEKENA